jgi:hypothetical protein
VGVHAASDSARSVAQAAAGIRRRRTMTTTVWHPRGAATGYPQPSPPLEVLCADPRRPADH